MRLAPFALAAIASLAVAAPAGARIVPQQGMIGVKLQMSGRDIVSQKGVPDEARTVKHPVMGTVSEYRYGKTKILFDGVGLAAHAMSFTTRDRKERTIRGIGIGSTKAQVKAKVAHAKCENELGVRHCYVGKFEAGERVTDFFLTKKNRVSSVTVGFVID